MVSNSQEYKEILEFYNAGVEKDRLNTGIGKIEFERTKEIILRYSGEKKQIIFEVGGGTGEYSRWLSGLGHQVHLLELSPNAVEYARELNKSVKQPIFEIEAANAIALDQPDEIADIVLLMGPIYHLTEKSDRLKALKEAKRVLKKGGILVTAAISRYGSTLWGLSVFGQKNDFIDDDVFYSMIARELADGQHIRPEKYPGFIARAFFHLPGEIRGEIEAAGFKYEKTIAVEGAVWIVPGFEEKWANSCSRKRLLEISRMVETHENIMGMSPIYWL